MGHNAKSTGLKQRPLICRSVSILQARFTQHQPLIRGNDPQQNQNALSIPLLAKFKHKSPILSSQIFICALFLIAQRQENQVETTSAISIAVVLGNSAGARSPQSSFLKQVFASWHQPPCCYSDTASDSQPSQAKAILSVFTQTKNYTKHTLWQHQALEHHHAVQEAIFS